MTGWLRALPLFVILAGIGSAAMVVPALHGTLVRDFATARAFAASATLALMLVAMLAIATHGRESRDPERSQLAALLGTFLLLPALLALPLHVALAPTPFHKAYFEMVSAITTTGASAYDDAPWRLNDTIHLWRALVGWLGGLLIWVAAAAILAPMNLGGYEILADRPGTSRGGQHTRLHGAEFSQRLKRHLGVLLPVYGGLTFLLWVVLMVAGDGVTAGLVHAMATLSTSGISASGGLAGSGAGLIGEMAIFVFLFLAVTRSVFAPQRGAPWRRQLRRDQELRLAMIILVVVSGVMFLRQLIGAADQDGALHAGDALGALWGSAFTTLSFLTTSGFASREWTDAQAWSGLGAPGVLLLGLALMGGGVATTAGGIKLLRVHALYEHGLNEIDRLVHPSAVAGHAPGMRRIDLQGAYMAWLFFMLFLAALIAVVLALSLLGPSFEEALVLAIAALSTTGPLAGLAGETPILYGTLGPASHAVLCAAMVLGRFEMLVMIAMLNPVFWRS